MPFTPPVSGLDLNHSPDRRKAKRGRKAAAHPAFPVPVLPSAAQLPGDLAFRFKLDSCNLFQIVADRIHATDHLVEARQQAFKLLHERHLRFALPPAADRLDFLVQLVDQVRRVLRLLLDVAATEFAWSGLNVSLPAISSFHLLSRTFGPVP